MIRLIPAIIAIYGFHEFISCEAQPYGNVYSFDGNQLQPYQSYVNYLPKSQLYNVIRFLLRTISEMRKNRIERSRLIPQFGNTVVQLHPRVPRSRYILPFFGHGNEIGSPKLKMNNFRNKPYSYRRNFWNDLIPQAFKKRCHKSRNSLHLGAPNDQQINPVDGLRQVKQYQPIVLNGIFFFGNPEVPKLATDLLSYSKPVVHEPRAIFIDTFGSPENQPDLKGEADGTSDEEDMLSTTVSTVNSEVSEHEEQEIPTEEDTLPTNVPTEQSEGLEKPELVDFGKWLNLLRKFKALLLQKQHLISPNKKLPKKQKQHLMSLNKKLPKKHSILESILSIIPEINETEYALSTTVSTTNDLEPSSFLHNIIVPQKYPDSENTVYGTTEENIYEPTEEENNSLKTDSTEQSGGLTTPEPDRPKIPAIDFLDKFKSMLQPKPFFIFPNITESLEQQNLNSTEYETTVTENTLSTIVSTAVSNTVSTIVATTASTTEFEVSSNSDQNLITKMVSNDVTINLPVTKISENINISTPLPSSNKLKIVTEALDSFAATTKLESDISEVTVTAIPTAHVYTNYQTTDNVAEISSNTTNQPEEPAVETNSEDGLKSKETKRKKRDTIDISAADAAPVDTFGQSSLLQVAIQECDEGFMRKTLRLLSANLPSFIDQYILLGALEKFSSRCNSDNFGYKSYSESADE